jgi:L-asparaginase II
VTLDAPVVAEVVRNGFVESRHAGRVLALDADRNEVLVVGDVDAPMFPRSSVKPLQAKGLLDAAWSPRDDEQVALACASHSGEPRHVDVVRRILADAGLDATALDNTPDLPLNADAARELVREGGGAERLFQNCSGKHAAMLAACACNGWPTLGYRDPQHPVQRAVRASIEQLIGAPVAAVAVDGCGAPLFAMSLRQLAIGFAALVGERVAVAMRAHPWLVGGTGRDVTALMESVDGVIAKDGAEGVYVAALPDGGVAAVKIEDGAARARGPVLAAALTALGVDVAAVGVLAQVPVLGHGEPVGAVRAVVD